jgi:hypothetical protein
MDRAFANLTIKNVSEDRREFEGWATTPTTDRQNDQLLPEGAEFQLPIPVLLDHNHTQVCGEVYRAEVSKAGIRFWARVRKITEPGAAKDFVDYCWALIKNSLRPMVSVGFQPLEYERLDNGGLRVTKWSWYELSAVAIGANPDAKVTATKAALGNRSRVVRVETARRKPSSVVKLSGVTRAAWNGTLKINTSPRNRAGDPFKIRKIKTNRTVVVKLDQEQRDRLALDEPKKPLPVVKLTAKDIERGRRRLNTRVVKLGR